jgi:hypothetical protein
LPITSRICWTASSAPEPTWPVNSLTPRGSPPMLGGVVRTVADRVEGYAREWQDQTVDQVFRAASDFTRRQPALVFGAAALAGFFMFRAMKSAPSTTPSPPIQPDQHMPGRDGYAQQGR